MCRLNQSQYNVEMASTQRFIIRLGKIFAYDKPDYRFMILIIWDALQL